MDKSEILNRVNEIFKDTFDNEDLVITEATVASDIAEWDSLNHINIMGHVQREFKIRFTLQEIANFKSIGDIVLAIQGKLT